MAVVGQLVDGMRSAFLTIKNEKGVLLSRYVHHCATKLQKVYRGHYTRKVTVPVKSAFKTLETTFTAIVKGWKIRRIMKTKEIQCHISQIKEFILAQKEMIQDITPSNKKKIDDLKRGLAASRYNTSVKMIALVHKMQKEGLWLLYK